MVSALIVVISILATLLLLLGLFAYQSYAHGMPQTESLQKKGSSKILSMFMMEFAYWLLRPLVKSLVWCRIHPNTISWGSVFFAIFGAVALARGFFGYGAFLFSIAFILDAVDGMVARMAGMVSGAGAVLDSTLDRYTEFLFFMGLLLYYRFDPIATGLIAAALCGSWMVSYSSAKAEAIDVKIPRGTMRRPERLVILVLGTVCAPILTPLLEPNEVLPANYPVLFSVGFVAVFSNFTAIHRVYCLYRVLSERTQAERYVIPPKSAMQRFWRAALASVLPTILDVGLMIALVETAGFHYLPAALLSVTVGTLVSYPLRQLFIFHGEEKENREFLREIVISVTNILWNGLLLYGLVEWLEMHYILGKLIGGLSVALVWNWPLRFRDMFPAEVLQPQAGPQKTVTHSYSDGPSIQ